MIDVELQNKIRTGEIDPNNQSLFFSALYKGLIYDLNKKVKIRGKYVPHFMLNTGDDIMYLEVKGQDHSIEPLEVSNENFIYNQVPRAMVEIGGIELQSDQLTSPYSNGNFELEYDDVLYGFHSEFRRMPIKTTLTAKYYFDTLTDALDASQQFISKLMFVQNFNISYLGQTIFVTYKVPTSIDRECNIQFDGLTSDNKCRVVNLEFEVETNFPVYIPETAILNSNYIVKLEGQIIPNNNRFEQVNNIVPHEINKWQDTSGQDTQD